MLPTLPTLQDHSLERMTEEEIEAQKALMKFTYHYGDSIHTVEKWSDPVNFCSSACITRLIWYFIKCISSSYDLWNTYPAGLRRSIYRRRNGLLRFVSSGLYIPESPPAVENNPSALERIQITRPVQRIAEIRHGMIECHIFSSLIRSSRILE